MASNKMTIDDVINALKIEEAKKLLIKSGFKVQLSDKRGPPLNIQEGNHIHDEFPQQHPISRVHSSLGERRPQTLLRPRMFHPTLTPLELVQHKLLRTMKKVHRVKVKQVRKLVDTLKKARWVKKRSAIMQLRLDNPTMTLLEIGQHFKLTRERIRQILKNNNVPTRAISKFPPVKCANCQKPMTNANGSAIHRTTSAPTKSYCNTQCREAKLYDYYPCEFCNKLIWILKTTYINHKARYTTFHCSHRCSHLHQWSMDGAINTWGKRGSKKENYHQHAGIVYNGYQLWHPIKQKHSGNFHNVNERS